MRIGFEHYEAAEGVKSNALVRDGGERGSIFGFGPVGGVLDVAYHEHLGFDLDFSFGPSRVTR